MRVLILGGDGYLGWPTAMRFSAARPRRLRRRQLLRRRWVEAQGSDSLTPILLARRADRRLEGGLRQGDRARTSARSRTPSSSRASITETKPEAIIHYGEQPSAPYSMASREQAVETQYANVIGNLNLLFFMRDHVPDAHLVKLGTMGEYGTPNIDIEEGYIEIEHKGRKDTLPVPEAAGLALPPLQGPRLAQHPLRLPHLGPARHRPEPGRRLRHRDRRDRAATSASPPASTTTRSSAPCSTASASRP